MLAYAARGPVPADRKSSPNAMLLIVAAHVGALALVMSAKMDIVRHFVEPPIRVDTLRVPPEIQPIPLPERPQPEQPQIAQSISRPDTLVPLPDPGPVEVGTAPAEQVPGTAGGGAGSVPIIEPRPTPLMVSRGPQLLTQGSDLRPPYPARKEAMGEEATLSLRLVIDADGRVLTVDPIGRADRVFAEAARRHIILHWRFRPALSSGHPTTSTTVISFAFRLND